MIGENIKRVCQFFGSASIMVLLQPSIELYSVFDYVLVLTQGGRQAYFGIIHITYIYILIFVQMMALLAWPVRCA